MILLFFFICENFLQIYNEIRSYLPQFLPPSFPFSHQFVPPNFRLFFVLYCFAFFDKLLNLASAKHMWMDM